jgi:hypothetical protein
MPSVEHLHYLVKAATKQNVHQLSIAQLRHRTCSRSLDLHLFGEKCCGDFQIVLWPFRANFLYDRSTVPHCSSIRRRDALTDLSLTIWAVLLWECISDYISQLKAAPHKAHLCLTAKRQLCRDKRRRGGLG